MFNLWWSFYITSILLLEHFYNVFINYKIETPFKPHSQKVYCLKNYEPLSKQPANFLWKQIK